MEYRAVVAARLDPMSFFCPFLGGGGSSPEMGTRILAITLLASGCIAAGAADSTAARVSFAESVVDVVAQSSAGRSRLASSTVTPAQASEPIDIVISLRLRHFAALQAILAAGGTVSRADMEANFLPARSEYAALCAWLTSQGFQITLADSRHSRIYARGSAAQAAAAFQVSLGRVATADGEFTSALSAPSLPAALGADVIGIDGLQPFIRLHPNAVSSQAMADFTHPSRAIPADLLQAYDVPAGLTGAGQTIAVFASTVPLSSDLQAFYQDVGVTSSGANFTTVPINGGPAQTGPSASGFNEVTMDTEWSTGIAPGAALQVYACPTGGIADFMATCTTILNNGGVNILTSSFSNPETEIAPASLQACSELLAQMAAAGISVFHGAGDDGAYGSPEYPTTDPYVTALGGTTLTFDANWNEVSEAVWPNTGGGYSTYFPRPPWQEGNGVPNSSFRCVPDAAAPASMVSAGGAVFSFVVLNGSTNTGIGGDSLTGPVWAGLTALINQARATSGLGPVGLYGPKIYPLIGTAAFTDITSGNDGGFSAGPGYDLCSGVGTPNVAALIQALSGQPSIAAQPRSEVVATGAMLVLTTRVAQPAGCTYQWYLDGAPIAGATDSSYVVEAAGEADAGSYTCVVTNASSSVSTLPATVTVQSTSDPGHLINLSVLTQSPVTVGFVTGGAGDEPLLLRASGPALSGFGVADVMANPDLVLYQGQASIGSNSNWNLNAGAVTAAETATGAFPFAAGSLDAAIVTSLPGGSYSFIISGANGTANATTLAEVYDDSPGPFASAQAHLINLSCLNQVASGGTFTGGFVVGGSTAETVLVRASGPALSAFGVQGVLPNPQLALHATINGADTVLAGNAGWGGNPAIAAAAAAVQAFPYTDAASADSAVLLTLPPGNYSAVVTSPSAASGACLIEVYDVPGN